MSETKTTNMVRKYWDMFSEKPFGKWLFNLFLARAVPYTSTIKARVVELSEGKTKIHMKDRKKIRNHLNSIHAIALANLGELACTLPLVYALPENGRCIVTEISMEYKKKARGNLVARADIEIPEITGRMEYFGEAGIFDSEGDEVARARVDWLLDIKKEKKETAETS